MVAENDQHGEETVHISWLGTTPPAPQPPTPRRKPLLIVVGAVIAALVVFGVVRVSSDADSTASTGASPSTTTSTAIDRPSPPTPSAETPPAASPPDLSAVAQRSRSSVVRVIASTCRGTGVATGFWIDDDSIVTSYYAVAEAVSLAVLDDEGDPVPATIKGVSPAHGVAVLTPARTTASAAMPVGADAATDEWLTTLELPDKSLDLHEPGAAQQTSTDGTLTQRETTHTGLGRLPGVSDISSAGAPVIDVSGQVRGMLLTVPDQFQRSVVPASQLLAATRSLTREEPGSCRRPTGPHSMTTITGEAPKEVRSVLMDYFGGINAADYAQAFDALGPAYHGPGSSLAGITKGWVSTYDFNIRIRDTGGSSASPHAWVTFDSIFAEGSGPAGLTCARWSIDYSFRRSGSGLKVRNNTAHDGGKLSRTEC